MPRSRCNRWRLFICFPFIFNTFVTGTVAPPKRWLGWSWHEGGPLSDLNVNQLGAFENQMKNWTGGKRSSRSSTPPSACQWAGGILEHQLNARRLPGSPARLNLSLRRVIHEANRCPSCVTFENRGWRTHRCDLNATWKNVQNWGNLYFEKWKWTRWVIGADVRTSRWRWRTRPSSAERPRPWWMSVRPVTSRCPPPSHLCV